MTEKKFSNVMLRLQKFRKVPDNVQNVVDDATFVTIVGMVNVCMQKYLYT